MCSKCVYLFLKNYDCVVKEYHFILFKEKEKKKKKKKKKKNKKVGPWEKKKCWNV